MLPPCPIVVVIPCYRVKDKIMTVLARIPAYVESVICVDDACPEQSGLFVKERCADPRVTVLFHDCNRGVGGAMVTGYRAALEKEETSIIVKIDGDGQMDPDLIQAFIVPILRGQCDYTKGNRFFHPEDLQGMPVLRVLGNGVLSFLTKLSAGYWDIFDPTNGYTAIHSAVLRCIPLDKVAPSYFFESDMLFRLNIARAVVRDIPVKSVYEDETSSLQIHRIIGPFLTKHGHNFMKRVGYNYFLRDFHIASLELFFGTLCMLFGLIFGLVKWHHSNLTGVPVTAGTVMLSSLPFLMGFQMILAFLQFDIQSVPRYPLVVNEKDAEFNAWLYTEEVLTASIG